MYQKLQIPSSFEAPPPLFKAIAVKDQAAQRQTALGKSPRRKLHVTGNKQELAPAEDTLAAGILAAGTPDTD